jgi:hypothetical protein
VNLTPLTIRASSWSSRVPPARAELLASGGGGGHAAVLAAPLLVAGCGCGLVTSANQTLTLHEITCAKAGLAAGI